MARTAPEDRKQFFAQLHSIASRIEELRSVTIQELNYQAQQVMRQAGEPELSTFVSEPDDLIAYIVGNEFSGVALARWGMIRTKGG